MLSIGIMDGLTLVPEMRKPFDIIAKGLSRLEWLPRLMDFRNWLLTLGEVEILTILMKELRLVTI